MTKEDEVKRFLGELAVSLIGTGIEDRARRENKENVWWEVAKALGEDMKENPERYYDLGELLYNK